MKTARRPFEHMKKISISTLIMLHLSSCGFNKQLIIENYSLIEDELVPNIQPCTKLESWSYYSDIKPWDHLRTDVNNYEQLGKLVHCYGDDTLIAHIGDSIKPEITSNLFDVFPGYSIILYRDNGKEYMIDEVHELNKFIGFIDNIQEAVLLLRSIDTTSYYCAIKNFTENYQAVLDYRETGKYYYFPVDYDPWRYSGYGMLNADFVERSKGRSNYKYLCKINRKTQKIQIIQR